MEENKNALKSIISSEINELQDYFISQFDNNNPLINKIRDYIILNQGKLFRPMLVFLFSKIFGNKNNLSYVAATMIEFVHIATLLHDDVLDNSSLRRGVTTVFKKYDSKTSILMGDYFLSTGLKLAIDNNTIEMLKYVSQAIKNMSIYEIIQDFNAKNKIYNQKDYFEVIYNKTAYLIASACACGTLAVTDEKKYVNLAFEFGKNIGLAFQIKDDLKDFLDENIIGKPSGNDLKEGKITLPLIYSLENSTYQEKKIILEIINNFNINNDIETIYKFIQKKDGFTYSQKIINDYISNAYEIINSLDINNDKKKILTDILEYISN